MGGSSQLERKFLAWVSTHISNHVDFRLLFRFPPPEHDDTKLCFDITGVNGETVLLKQEDIGSLLLFHSHL